MKKLLVLSLTVVMVLAFSAVSMADTFTVGGELNFGKSWDGAGDLHYYLGSEANVSNAKVTFTALIADDIHAFAALKGDSGSGVTIDETWVQFTKDYGTIKIGYFGYSQDQKDIIDDVIPDIKSGLTVAYTARLTDQLTLNLVAANDGNGGIGNNHRQWMLRRPGTGLDYSVGLAYDTDSFGINANYFKFTGVNTLLISSDQFSAFSMMGYFKLDALKFYAQYDNNNFQRATVRLFPVVLGVQNFIIGAVYDSADVPLFVRAEYDLNDQHTRSNEWALRLGYKMTSNVKFQFTMMRHNWCYVDLNSAPIKADNYNTNELLLITTF